MPDESTAWIDSIWQETTCEREIDLAKARATYSEAVAAAERTFAQRLSERAVAEIIARRDQDSSTSSASGAMR